MSQSTKLSRSGRKLLGFAELKPAKGIPYSRQWITLLVERGKFPKPVKPGGGGRNAWFDDEIDDYLNNLAAERDRDQVA
jgi:predicted DNA-binding transcriptional regulator AlpA